MPTLEHREQRVLVLAPRGRDADVIAGVLARDAIDAEVVDDVDRLLEAAGNGAAAAVVSEEALSPGALARLSRWLADQAPWSDFPFVVLLAKRAGTAPPPLKAMLAELGNVVLFERPLSADTLATAATAARRARRKQYQAREVLAQRQAVAEELAFLNEHLESRVDERTRALAQANDRLAAEIMVRERAEQAVIQAQKLEALGRLTGGVAHDFNNVLNVIQGNMDLITMVSRDETVKARAKMAQAACKRGAKLTAQLLTFARNQSLDLRAVAVRPLFDQVTALAKPVIGSGIEFVCSVDHDVECILADESQTEMALLNLVINARDAIEGRGRIILHASPAQAPAAGLADGRYVRIAVSDDGAGMSPEIAAKVFEPFFTTKGVGKGTGLGLSQAYGMAKQSGGTVVIHSEPGQGTAVEVWLPVSDDPVDVECAQAPRHHALSGLKVLVVEDDDAVRAGLVDALLNLGCDVKQAAGGADGLEALRNDRPDLLLTDYLMPGITGADLAVQARALFPDLPVLIATGYADMGAIEEAIGDDAVLRKPFQLAELNAAMARVLRRQTSRA